MLELDLQSTVNILSHYYDISTQLIDGNTALQFIKESERRQSLNRYRHIPTEPGNMYAEFSIPQESEWITQIVFEEWGFLTTQSWLLAKVRKPFDHMIEAGATAIEISKKTMEKAIRTTVKKDPTLDLSFKDKAVAVAKWVAVGGSSASSLIEPVTGAVISFAAGMFLLYDP